ncbi:hypothetical protein [Clostridium cylindrosporum]|uniref:Uncharacterized protein n=1 Tax=Clostridium cylindrosporum DSM 605 TaxID=1121307 RepID=A0A0J8DBD3_CLOCY|nr:hypothetical protein [Clostridium cylindrosporum]KMT21619.1 hypothetical protein CLCY_2c03810 [Clostridium cylindrosporum DSM 605]
MSRTDELKRVGEHCKDYGYHGFISARDLAVGRSCETCGNWSDHCEIDVYDKVVSSLEDNKSFS